MPNNDPYLDRTAISPHGWFLSSEAWRRFAVDEIGGADSGGGVRLARELAARLNAARDFSRPDTRPARAGELLTLGLLTRVLRHIAISYCRDFHPRAMEEALSHLRATAGTALVERVLPAFVDTFAPEPVRRGETAAARWLQGAAGAMSHRETATVESLLARVVNENRAADPYLDLHDLRPLSSTVPFTDYINGLEAWLAGLPACPGTGLSLPDTLRAPLRACPDSLDGQVAFILKEWAVWLPPELIEALMVARGVMREETAMRGHGPGPQRALSFGAPGDYPEPEAFTRDEDWMPNVVLLAKTVYVWLDQLSKKYLRPVNRLDQVPDEELDQLAHWGFNALWLIGLWERSSASRDIKRRMGNPEAESSAYSLYDYDIAWDLGGEAAYHDLAARAWRRGIRLASDMVPNHMGIYSRWVVEHPDWFMQLDAPPFPNYTFNGPDLSPDPGVAIQIEDGYWTHSDAAVVFRRTDRRTGETRFIYHGNDGTSMPWNDTAQLNFMLPAVREAVTQTILHVARKSPIIRFDAAMTLAKRHYQRLWFPRPGEGGAIPSRAEHGMSREDFDRAFPVEFWRQVVDRVAAETPNTLLLAEAFWLMEGYFVRTLGMHRVYNSAFMNMLKMEENSQYRQTVKNVLEFSPEVLQRFVNFMNNPDEETAEAQFGKGDKYFGVAVMLATMPGLPMFGHGQIEGFTEKYGMEYRRAYRDETPDRGLVSRHEREIFPIMRRRHLFSGARHFALYDFVSPAGWVNENVFAYSNQSGGERGLVVFNNAHSNARGVLHTSTAINEGSAEDRRLRRVTLGEAMGLRAAPEAYVIFREHRTGLEYLHHSPTLADQGLHLELGGYEHRVMLDWRHAEDHDGSWARLHAMLGGRGVPSMEEAWQELRLAPLLDPFRAFIAPDTFERLAAGELDWDTVAKRMETFLDAVGAWTGMPVNAGEILERTRGEITRLRQWSATAKNARLDAETDEWLAGWADGAPPLNLETWRAPLAVALLRHLGLLLRESASSPAAAAPENGGLLAAAQPRNGDAFDPQAASAQWMREWFLTRQVARSFQEMGGDEWRAAMDARLVRVILAHGPGLRSLRTEVWGPVLHSLFVDPDTRAFLAVNHFGGRNWLNCEQLERMLRNFLFSAAVDWAAPGGAVNSGLSEMLPPLLEDLRTLVETAEDTGYDLDWMLEALV